MIFLAWMMPIASSEPKRYTDGINVPMVRCYKLTNLNVCSLLQGIDNRLVVFCFEGYIEIRNRIEYSNFENIYFGALITLPELSQADTALAALQSSTASR